MYPEGWKDSKVIPLHKKDDVFNPKNYRPVAIIPILSKVMERAVFQQTMNYLVENSLLNSNHHAYRSNHSTTTAMIEMMDIWTQVVDSGEMAGVCMLDMSAAFDVVDHDILLQKMSVYGFSRDMVAWFCSYLSNRRQCVAINGTLSNLLPVSSGVPQGSILGQLLYLLYTSDLPTVVKEHVGN